MRAFVDGQIYVHEYPVRFAGGSLLTRMTLIVLDDGGVIVHSPVAFDAALEMQVRELGETVAIVAPSTCHHLFVADAQRVFPSVPTYAVEGLAKKRPDLVLQTLPDELWKGEIDRVVIGNRVMRELLMLHRRSRTLIVVDAVEHFCDDTPGVDRVMRFWVKTLGMWNARPQPAPELRWLTRDRGAARRALERVLAWDWDRMVIAHGEPFERDAKDVLRRAWKFVLR
jgi:hypothetical protein